MTDNTLLHLYSKILTIPSHNFFVLPFYQIIGQCATIILMDSDDLIDAHIFLCTKMYLFYIYLVNFDYFLKKNFHQILYFITILM